MKTKTTGIFNKFAFVNVILSSIIIITFVFFINSCGEKPTDVKIDIIDTYYFNDTNLVGTIAPLHFYRINLNQYNDIDRRINDYEKNFSNIEAYLQIEDKNINNFYTLKIGTRIDNSFIFQNDFVVNGKTYKYNVKFYFKDPLLNDKKIIMLTSDFKNDTLEQYFKNIHYTLDLVY